jgi:molecular chaperone GrpE (heat shock protein)
VKASLPSAVVPKNSSQQPSPVLIVFGGLTCAVIGSLVTQLFKKGRQSSAVGQETAIKEISETVQADSGEIGDLKKVSRRLDMTAQDLSAAQVEYQAELSNLKREILENSSLRNAILEQKSKIQDWEQTAMDFIDALMRASSLPGLSEERKDSWRKALQDFKRLCIQRGLDTIEPQVGDDYVPGMHRVRELVGNEAFHVVECIEVGFRRGEDVIRPALVDCGP